MRGQSKDFLRKFLDNHGPFDRILDVGSMDVDGGGPIKGFFDGRDYVGVDLREGLNVNIVVNAHELDSKFGPGSFDLVICFDTLEHDDRFWLTVDQMKKVLKRGGYLVLGVPGRECPLHEHPGDYWRFMPGSFKDYFFQGDFDDVLIEPEGKAELGDQESYGYGRKI